MKPLEPESVEELVEEAEEGRSERTPFIVLAGVTIAVSLLAGLVVGLVFLVQQLF